MPASPMRQAFPGLLAAHLDGWADEAILDSYQAERLPITEQVSHLAMNHALAMNKARKEVPREIEADGPEGQRVRAAIGKAAYDLNVSSIAAPGSISATIIKAHRSSPMMATLLRPTAWASLLRPLRLARACRICGWPLAARYMTRWAHIIRCCASVVDVSALTAAAEDARMPLTVLDVPRQVTSDVYRHALLLARPDQHVAWRGDAVPPDPRALVDVLRGARRRTARVAA
jgi:hypothetical protein